jgi:PAS domain S-box-containing protein
VKSDVVSSEWLLRLLLEQGRDHSLVLLDEKGLVVDWLMAAAKLFGYKTEEVLDRYYDFLFVPEDCERGVPHSELDIGAKFGRQEDDRWMLRKDGVRIWVSGILTCLYGPDGKVAGYCKVMRDRTDLKEHVELLNNRAKTLETEVQQKNVLLGTLAHELRNPLGVLSNATQLMGMIYPDDQKLEPVTQLIGRQVKYLSTLIEDLLENARLQAGKVELQVKPIDLCDVLANAIESVVSIQEKRQKTELILPQSPIEVCVDPVKAKQVFVNLLSNASKFSDEGKTIWVRAITEDDQAVVRVEDEGRGISPEMLPRLFEMFSQGDVSHGHASLGLGLSIVKQYVELHGGTVQARSEGPNRGSMFVVRLPLVEKAG